MGKIQDNYKLIVFQSGNKYDFTEMINGLEWTSDIDTLGSQLTFSVANIPGQIQIYAGDMVSLLNNGSEIFRGVVPDEERNVMSKSITAFDFAWYLNKSKCPIQFKEVGASKAIEQLCIKMNVPICRIIGMGTLITKIYKSETVADIIKDIINQYELESGNKVRMEMLTGKLMIYKWGDIVIDPVIKLTDALAPISIVEAFGSGWSMKRSISDMVNSVVAVQGEEYTTVQDAKSIAKYGLLQETIDVDPEQNPLTQARNTLAIRNVIPEDLTLPLLGDDSIIAGRILKLPGQISGKWLITNANHTVVSKIHKCDVTLRRVGS